jgi:hypothetical protein
MASSQGSRTALVSWIVVLAITSVAAIIFAFYYSAAARRSDLELTDLKKQYNDIVAPAALPGQDISALRDARQQENSGFAPGEKLLNVALDQRDHLIKLVTGSVTAPTAAEAAARTTLAGAADKLKPAGVTLPSASDNLDAAVNTLSDTVVDRQNVIKGLNDQVAAARKAEAEAAKRAADAQAAADKQIADVRAQADKQVADANSARGANKATVDQIQAAVDTERKAAADAQQKLTAAIAERDAQIKKLNKDLDTAKSRFANRRPDPSSAVITHPDAVVVRTAADVVYINLGQGDQLPVGMTFEVYDKASGIPPLQESAGEETLPEGKASIEVTRVGPTASECRVVHTKPGAAPITEGDYVTNLVYDRNTKYSFYVYGKFDLDQNGLATANDTETVKRLITQWGGKIAPDLSVDTDFVVIGREPVLPNYTKDEREDPINAKRLSDAQAELDAYQATVNKAKELRIPILNQNRFLYYIGYYDQAKR